ncbi:MAG: hypothetical protein M1831_004350 [Alyxoria varia]|nr:MAG: hypothetical protein M1831_004350 [Alyxoria varia]
MAGGAPIGVALIGSGIFAREQHLPAVLSNPVLSLKAIYSRTLHSCSTLSSSVPHKVDWYSEETVEDGRGLKDMLSNTNIRAVIIALPIILQPEFIKRALEAGKSVLSEKPISKDVESAKSLIEYYKSLAELNVGGAGNDVGAGGSPKPTWSVAENWRFLESHALAAKEIQRLGRVLGFRANVNRNIQPGGKYFETSWRKAPEYQGGFLLDGGVHFTAALRMLLGSENALTRLSAFSVELQEHLPPVDTVNATLKTSTGISGTMAISMGTTFKGTGFTVACEKGTVTVGRSQVAVCDNDGQEVIKDFPNEGQGVAQEVETWATSMCTGVRDARLYPEEALKDLEVLEAMLRSGERDGMPVDLKLQSAAEQS